MISDFDKEIAHLKELLAEEQAMKAKALEQNKSLDAKSMKMMEDTE